MYIRDQFDTVWNESQDTLSRTSFHRTPPTFLQQWELPVSPLQAAVAKGHPRSSASGTPAPWGRAAGRLGRPTGGSSAPCGRPRYIHCPADAGAHLRDKSRLFRCTTKGSPTLVETTWTHGSHKFSFLLLSWRQFSQRFMQFDPVLQCYLFRLLVIVLC